MKEQIQNGKKKGKKVTKIDKEIDEDIQIKSESEWERKNNNERHLAYLTLYREGMKVETGIGEKKKEKSDEDR